MISGGKATLFVADVAAAVRFYVETLGLKLVAETPEESVVDAGGFLVGLTAGSRRPSAPLTLYTKVPLAEAIAIFENRGVRFRPGTSELEDPDGNPLRLALALAEAFTSS